MIDQKAIKEKVMKWLDSKLSREGEYFLVDIKMPGRNKLQVFVDGDNGITIDKCAEISRYLEQFLDEEKILGERYVLEVSSPGMNSPFKVLRQYRRRIGSEVNVVKYDGQRVDGILKGADEEKVVVDQVIRKKKKTETNTVEIPFSEIKRTKLNF